MEYYIYEGLGMIGRMQFNVMLIGDLAPGHEGS